MHGTILGTTATNGNGRDCDDGGVDAGAAPRTWVASFGAGPSEVQVEHYKADFAPRHSSESSQEVVTVDQDQDMGVDADAGENDDDREIAVVAAAVENTDTAVVEVGAGFDFVVAVAAAIAGASLKHERKVTEITSMLRGSEGEDKCVHVLQVVEGIRFLQSQSIPASMARTVHCGYLPLRTPRSRDCWACCYWQCCCCDGSQPADDCC